MQEQFLKWPEFEIWDFLIAHRSRKDVNRRSCVEEVLDIQVVIKYFLHALIAMRIGIRDAGNSERRSSLNLIHLFQRTNNNY